MTVTDILAWLGGLTGPSAIVWDVYKWKRSGPKLLVRVSPNMAILGRGQVTNQRHLIVRVANSGEKKTTLTTLALALYPSWWAQVRGKPSEQFAVPMPGGPGWRNLPCPLDPGEEWAGMVRQDQQIEQMCKKGRLYCHVYHALSKNPVGARVVLS